MSREPLPEGWKTAGMMSETHKRTANFWFKRMHRLGELLTAEIADCFGMPKEEARAMVEYTLVGKRTTHGSSVPSLAASPDAQRLLDDPKILSRLVDGPPQSLEGWRTGSMMARHERGKGSAVTLDKRIRKLGDLLTKEIVEQLKVPKKEARAIVEYNLVGLRSFGGGRPAVAASPHALRLLDDPGVRRLLDGFYAPAMDGWTTGHEMSRNFAGGNTAWDKRIRAFGEKLTRDIAEKLHVPEAEARAIVEHNLVGLRTPAYGRPAFAASPDAARVLEDKHGGRRER